MQISAFNKKGKRVQASISDFAKKMRRESETYKMGNSPTQFVYTDQRNQKTRTIDLQEAAVAGGMRDVQFKFDADSMREQGYMNDDSEVDSGAAYNIERIKTKRGKDAYLKDQGYQNVYQDGENYFHMKNGKMTPINNKDGIDTTDFVRFGANLGRDLGSLLGAGAAIGGGAVAAVPTLGTSLGVGIAAAGVAGAAGGVVGEGIQRGIESMFGIESSKYNEDMTTEEEMSSVGESAFIGGIGGVLQPLMVASGGKLQGWLGKKLLKSSSEFVAKQGAKMEANALSARLPQGYLQKFATSEEAAASSEMGKAVLATSKNELSGKGLQSVTQETEEMLASGIAKKGENEMRESATQGVMHDAWKSRELEKGMADAEKRQTQDMMIQGMSDEISIAREQAVVRAEDSLGHLYPSAKKDLSKVFDVASDSIESAQAQARVIKSQLNNWKQNKFKGLQYDYDESELIGFNQDSLDGFIQKNVEGIIAKADDYLGSFRHNVPTLETVPGADTKKAVSDSLSIQIKNMASDEERAIVKNLISSINTHGSDDIKVIRKAFDDFHTSVRDSKSKNLSEITEALESYESMSSQSQQAVKQFYSGQKKRIEMSNIVGERGQIKNVDMIEGAIRGLNDLGKITGDPDGRWSDPLLNAVHFDAMLTEKGSPYGDMLTDSSRKAFNSFNFVREIGKKENRFSYEDAASKSAKSSMMFMGGFSASIISGQSMSDSFIAGMGAAKGKSYLSHYSKKLTSSTGVKGVKALGKSSYRGTKGLGSSALKKAERNSGTIRDASTRMGTEEYLRQ